MINNNIQTGEEILRKLAFIDTHNQINRLTIENKQKEEKIKNISDKSKKIISSYMKNIETLNNRIKELEKQNDALTQEKKHYESIVESIPSFILKIFSKNKKMLQS